MYCRREHAGLEILSPGGVIHRHLGYGKGLRHHLPFKWMMYNKPPIFGTQYEVG